jgi:hypothetical protein
MKHLLEAKWASASEEIPWIIWYPNYMVPKFYGTQIIWYPNCMVPKLYGAQIIWYPKTHYHVNVGLTLVPIATQLNPAHAIPFYGFKIYCNNVLCIPKVFLMVFFLQNLPPILCTHFSSPSRMPHAWRISSSLIFSPLQHLVISTNHGGIFCEIFSITLPI